jgi:tetratricopeptide (TPR) repeat protein
MRSIHFKYQAFLVILAVFAVCFLFSASLPADTPGAPEVQGEVSPNAPGEPASSPGSGNVAAKADPEPDLAPEPPKETTAASEPGDGSSAAAEGEAAKPEASETASSVGTDSEKAASSEETAIIAASGSMEGTEAEAAELYGKGLYAAAEQKYKELVALAETNAGPENPKTLGLKIKYVTALSKAGHFGEAAKYAEELSPKAVKVLGEFSEENMSLENIYVLSLLFDSVLDKTKPRQGLSEEEKIIAKRTSFLGSDNPQTLIALRQFIQIKTFEETVSMEDFESLREILAMHERILGERHPETLETSHQLASAMLDIYGRDDKKLTKAEEKEIKDLIAKTLAGRKAIYGEVHPDVSETMSLYVLTDIELKNFQKAYDEILKVSDIEVKTLGPDHPWSVNSYIIMAALLRDVGDPADVLKMYEKALNSSLAFYGGENSRSNTIRTYLASYYLSFTEDSAKALEILSQVLAWQEKNLGADHPYTLETLSFLANVYDETGDFKKARPLYEMILKSRMATLGANHEDTLIIKNRLAYQKILEGETDKAREVYEKIYNETKESLGPEHIETLRIQVPLALVYGKDGENLKSKYLLEQAAESFKKLKGPDDYETLDAETYLSTVYYELGDYEAARALAGKVLEARERTQGASHEDTLNARNNLAYIYVVLKDEKKARPLLENVVKAQTDLYGPSDPRTLSSRQNLASVYKDLGLKSEAKDMYVSLLTDVEKLHGARDPITTHIRNQLALVF